MGRAYIYKYLKDYLYTFKKKKKLLGLNIVKKEIKKIKKFYRVGKGRR